MSNDAATEKKSLRNKVKDRVKPPPSKASGYRSRALETLAALLGSEDEAIRLQAAQALLVHAKGSEKSRPAADLVKKVVGGPLKKR